jgi:hypothetical protein
MALLKKVEPDVPIGLERILSETSPLGTAASTFLLHHHALTGVCCVFGNTLSRLMRALTAAR